LEAKETPQHKKKRRGARLPDYRGKKGKPSFFSEESCAKRLRGKLSGRERGRLSTGKTVTTD